MQTRRIGRFEVSVVGLGCNNFGMRIGQDETRSVVDAALEAGITYYDTADVYGQTRSEEFLGAALGDRRDEVVLATKFGSMGSSDGTLSGGHPDWVRRAVDDSLGRLGTDRIDHYQYHRLDPDVPLVETMGALGELVESGKVLEVGCSNFDAGLLDEAGGLSSAHGHPGFVSVQNHYSLLHREPEHGVIDACRRLGVALVPYFPLESGLLTGKVDPSGTPPPDSRLAMMPDDRRDRFIDRQRLDAVERLRGWAADHQRSLLELAFAWLLAEPTVATVIAGATKPEQVHANAAAGSWTLTPEERSEVSALVA